MIAVITADGSVVFSLPNGSVHIDAQRRMVHVQNPHLPGATTRSFPAAEAELVSRPAEGDVLHFHLACDGGEQLELGPLPAGEISRQISRAVRRISGRAASARPPEPYHEAETRRLPYPASGQGLALQYAETKDELELDIEVTIPPEEGPGRAPARADSAAEFEPTVPIRLLPRADSTP